MDDGFQRHIQQAASSFKEAIRHSVSEHLISKYTGVRRQLTHLDDRDMDQARAIARRQILRSNQRMTADRVDRLLTVVQQDVASTEVPFVKPRPPGPGVGTPKPASNPPGASSTTPRSRQPSTAAAAAIDAVPSPVQTIASPATTPLPSPSGRPPSRVASISLFAPQHRGAWAIPQLFDREETLLLTDSNGRVLHHAAPESQHTAEAVSGTSAKSWNRRPSHRT